MAGSRCPKCQHDLKAIDHEGVTADYCRTCGGLWLDRGELARVDGCPDDLPPRDVAEAEQVRPTPFRCPACDGVLREREFVPGSRLWLDQCADCGGLWFDAGELRRARALRGRRRRPVTWSEAGEIDALRREWHRQRAESGRRDPPRAAAPATEPPADPHKGSRVYLFQLLTSLPVEVHNPTQHFPYVTVTFIVANVLLFLFTITAPDPQVVVATWGTTPADVLRGQHLLTLLSSMFLHGGWLHLLGNMYFLWTFGDNVEDVLRPVRYLIFYLVCGMAATLSHVIAEGPSVVPLVGASGAIAGAMGAYMVLFRDRLIYVVFFFIQFKVPAPVYLVFWVGYQLVLAAIGGVGNVAWWAHVGGFGAGVIMALSFKLREKLEAAETPT